MRVCCGEEWCFSEGGGVGRSGASVRVVVWGGVVLQ